MRERVLSLDISTKTGWAFALSSEDGFVLVDYGKMEPVSEPDEKYPGSYVTWAYACFNKIMELIGKFKPETLVIEETSGGSKSAYSQKILEYIHFLMAYYIRTNNVNAVYMQTEEWRRIVGCLMTKEEKAQNKKVREARKVNPDIKVVKSDKGKRIGIVGKKHVNVRKANELFKDHLREPFKLKDEDKADGLLMNYAYHLRQRMKDE